MASKTALNDSSTDFLTVQGRVKVSVCEKYLAKHVFKLVFANCDISVCVIWPNNSFLCPKSHFQATFIVCSADAHCQNLTQGVQKLMFVVISLLSLAAYANTCDNLTNLRTVAHTVDGINPVFNWKSPQSRCIQS